MPKPNRRPLRYALRTMLIVVLVLSVWLGWREYRAPKHLDPEAVLAIQRHGDVELKYIGPSSLPGTAEYRYRINQVRLHPERLQDVLPHLKKVGPAHVRFVGLMNPLYDAPQYCTNLRNAVLLLSKDMPESMFSVYDDAQVLSGEELIRFGRALCDAAPASDDTGHEAKQELRNSLGWPVALAFYSLWELPHDEIAEVLILAPDRAWPQAPVKFFLLCDGTFVDWRALEFGAALGPRLYDIDGDRQPEVGLSCELSERRARSLRNASESWVDAYDITPTGFVSLFDESAESDR